MPVFEIQSPEGQIFEVDAPDMQTAADSFKTFSSGQHSNMTAKTDANPSAQPAPQQPAPAAGSSDGTSFTTDAIDTLTMGAAPKIASGLGAGIDWLAGGGPGYDQRLAEIRASKAAFQNEHPYQDAAAQAAGTLAGAAVLPASTIGKGAGLLGEALDAGLTGFGYGTASGALQDANSVDERMNNALTQGSESAAIAPVLSTFLTRMLPFAKQVPQGPSTADIGAAKKANFATAENGGVTFDPQAFKGVTQDIVNEAKKADISVVGAADEDFPKSFRLVKRMEARSADHAAPGLMELNAMKRRASGIGRDESSTTVGKMAAGKIRDFINDPTGIIAGDPAAVSALKEANTLTQREKKAEILDLAGEQIANRQGANPVLSDKENPIRQVMKGIANQKDFKTQWTPQEQNAIHEIVRNTNDPIHTLLRLFGIMAPSGKLSLGGYAGTALGSLFTPAGSVVAPAIGGAVATGIGARAASTSLTNKKVDALNYLVRTGQQAPDGIIEHVLKNFLNIYAAPMTAGKLGGQ